MLDSDQQIVAISKVACRLLAIDSANFTGAKLDMVLARSARIDRQDIGRVVRACQTIDQNAVLLLRSATGGTSLEAHIQPLENGHASVVLQFEGAKAPGSADRLTGLLDRAGFIGALKTIFRNRLLDRGLVVFSIDLERFSWVNDIYGHSQGDAVLTQIASRIVSCLGTGDIAARLRGSEFVLAAKLESGPKAALNYAARLMAAMGDACVLDSQPVLVKPVIGIALAPEHGHDPQSLIRAAGLAMRQAGQDHSATRVFQHAMLSEANQRLAMELDLRKAIKRQEFELYYQPQFDTGTGTLAGFEGLLRWNHPERGLVPPGDFIPLAEELGLIVEIGDWVLKEGCRQAMTWPTPLYVSINVSGLQFDGGNLVKSVGEALAQSGLRGSRLEVEITESALLRPSDDVLETLNALREMGARISMDDFGTGYSSLTQLHQFPFDKLKIDRSFVSRIGRNNDGLAIVRAIAKMGSSLGLRTVAEGVETLEQWDLLKAEGCDEAQGYLLGRPTPASKLTGMLTDFLEAQSA